MNNFIKLLSIKTIIALILLVSFTLRLEAFDAKNGIDTYVSPSFRFNSIHNIPAIISKFKSYGVTNAHLQLFDKVMAAEEYGFFGYHGARRDFRIYQDIIRIGIEEVLSIPIRSDFQFFRIPGDPIQNVGSAKKFLETHNNYVRDDNPLESQQLLSVNMALYEFYWNDLNCSIYYFVKDYNFIKHSYEDKLILFFILLGIDPKYIHDAFEIGRQTLDSSAVLIQLFDASNYSMMDTQTYLAHISGGPFTSSESPADYLLNPGNVNFPQLRLMMDNRFALNPCSSLIVKRYDLNDEQTVVHYEQKLREYFQKLSVNNSQQEIYKNQLLSIWEIENQ